MLGMEIQHMVLQRFWPMLPPIGISVQAVITETGMKTARSHGIQEGGRMA